MPLSLAFAIGVFGIGITVVGTYRIFRICSIIDDKTFVAPIVTCIILIAVGIGTISILCTSFYHEYLDNTTATEQAIDLSILSTATTEQIEAESSTIVYSSEHTMTLVYVDSDDNLITQDIIITYELHTFSGKYTKYHRYELNDGSTIHTQDGVGLRWKDKDGNTIINTISYIIY